MNVQSLEWIKNSTIMFSFSNYYINIINVQSLEQIIFPLLPWEYRILSGLISTKIHIVAGL